MLPQTLYIRSTPGQTVYAVTVRLSDTAYFNTSTGVFEQFNGTNWENYAIALSGDAVGNYTASLPSGFPSDQDAYRVTYYAQGGGSAADTDSCLGSHDLVWTGAQAYKTDIHALTTLAGVKTQLRIITSISDIQLVGLINAASEKIERICGRRFLARDYAEFYDGNHQLRLVLRNNPVNHIGRLAYGQQNAMWVTFAGTAVRATAGIGKGTARLFSMASNGTVTTKDLSLVQYPTCSTLAAAINAISGWQATVDQDVPTEELYPTGGQDAMSRQVFWDYPFFGTPEYEVDYSRGMLQFRRGAIWPNEQGWFNQILPTRIPGGFRQVFVRYNAGYSEIPSDVEQKAREVVQDMFNVGRSDATKASVKIGDLAYTNATPEQIEAKIRSGLSRFIDQSQFVGGTRS